MECIWTGKRWWRDREKGPGKKWVKSVDYGWWEHVHEELHRRVTMHKEVTCMWGRNGFIPLSDVGPCKHLLAASRDKSSEPMVASL